MTIEDLVFYIMDAAIFALLCKMLKNSKEVELEVKVNGRWFIPLMFLAVAVLSFLRYSGVFRYIQTICLILFAGMYYCMKSGLSEKGIVSMGSLVKYEKSGKIRIVPKENAIYYGPGKKQSILYFEDGRAKEIATYLQKHTQK